jgi:UDP-N-acetylglucosamine--N-acetylmuramyl-(pentapeptide) pyrophosphoryl-undecaprenol N-acetylglucosamine transferase
MSTKTILIAGGGTGGHVFPALAVADALRHAADVQIVFAGTARGLETKIVPEHGHRLELLQVIPMKGGGAARAMRGALVAARETVRAASLVKRVAPQVVLSVGGYAAGPVSLAAAVRGVPLAILEPNSVPGLANRMLAPIAKRAYVAWGEAASRFRQGTVRLFGVPLRAGFAPHAYVPHGTARVLVMGGSQGAAALNERLPLALAEVARAVPSLEVVHQSGRDREGAVREAYARTGLARVNVVPFLERVAEEIALADVVVARAGAVTLAEIAAIGRASVLVPFPFAADDHQAKNAIALARDGAAVCVRQDEADPRRLAHDIAALLLDDGRRTRMADQARTFGRPMAAREVATDLLALAGVPVLHRAVMNGAQNGGGGPHSLEVR